MKSPIRVLGFSGSPRRGGNSELLLDMALKSVVRHGAVAEKIVLNELSIAPCQECGGCDLTGRCVVQDEMQGIYPKLRAAEILIIATPTFFSGPSAQLKAMIDRTQACWVERFVLKRPISDSSTARTGLLLAVGARGGQDNFISVEKIVKTFLYTQNAKLAQGLFFPKVDAKGEIANVAGAAEQVEQSMASLFLDCK